MTDSKRRLLLKAGLTTGLMGITAAIGLLTPLRAFAVWPAAAFDAKYVSEVIDNLFGDVEVYENAPGIELDVIDWAENGAVVPITVTSSLEGVESIVILVDKNPVSPLVARFDLAPNTQAFIKTNIKMAETSNVIALVKSGDKFYSASKKVKVTINGCGD